MKKLFTRRKNLQAALSILVIFSVFAGISVVDIPVAAAAVNPNCSNGPDPALGTDLVTASVPAAGTYTVWSRIQADTAANNAYNLQIDCGAPIAVGGASLTAGSWTWVNFRDGNTASRITTALTAGNHSFNLTGKSPNLMVDRVILSSDAACTPTGTGDNCALGSSPTPTVSVGDVNKDGKVDVVDLSLLLSHWSTNYPAADFDKDGNVTIFDLSLMLSHWTG